MEDSILNSTKKVLGISPDYLEFDDDILMHLNTVIAVARQLGVHSESGFSVEDATTSWSEYLGDHSEFVSIKTYIFTQVKLMFDPPQTSFALESLNNMASMLEFRLAVEADTPTY